MGEKRYLDIGEKTKQRLGFYKEITDVVDIKVVDWYKKEGDIIGAIEDPDTGLKTGEKILLIDSAKGEKDIDGIGWEIGTRISKILIPAGEIVIIDIRYEPFRPAELEIIDGHDIPKKPLETIPQKEVSGVPIISGENKNEIASEQPQNHIRISPLARVVAEELGISLDGLTSFCIQNGLIEAMREDVLAFHESVKQHVQVMSDRSEVKAAPDVKQRITVLTKESKLDIRDIIPTGPDGIIRMADVERALAKNKEKAITKNTDVIDEMSEEALYASVIEQPQVRRLTIARSQQRAWNSNYTPGRGINIPMAGGGRDIDFTNLVALREKLKKSFMEEHGIKIRYDHFFLAVAAKLLRRKELSILNSCWEWLENKRGQIVRFGHINLAIAVDHPAGLLVPVIRRCEEKSFVAIAKEAEEIFIKVQNNAIEIERMEGRTFTVNNAGALGVEYPHPVVPEGNAAIVAFGRARKNGLMYVEIKFDHRPFDAGPPEHFMTELKRILEESPEELLYI